MRIGALCASSTQCCKLEILDSTTAKVGVIAISALLSIGGIALYLCHTNSIAAFTLMGAGGVTFLGSIFLYQHHQIPISDSPLKSQPPRSSSILNLESLSSATSEEDLLIIPEDAVFLLQIKDRKNQLERFEALDRTSKSGYADKKSLEIGTPLLCDGFPGTGFPSRTNRVTLFDGTMTNGALVWDKLVLMGGPQSESQIEHLWRIAAEIEAKAIIRLGPLIGYKNYCPSDFPLKFDRLSINPTQVEPECLFDTTTCVRFSMECNRNMRSFPIFAIEGWKDFGTNQCPEIHKLIMEIDHLSGPVIIHCRGGFGRTGSFACCWKIYQEFKAAKREEKGIEIDPVAIIDQMRNARTALVQNNEQFLMILSYIDFLNSISYEEMASD